MPVNCRRPRLGAAFVLRALLTSALTILVGSCGNTTIDAGTPIITVTATNSRFTSFVVNIDGISLTRDDGNVFTALGVVERADLTKVVDLTELLEAPAIPTGTYTTGTITLDFTGAALNVDVNGQSVALTPVDTTGAGATTTSVTFNLDPSHPLVINHQQGVRFGLEFDLAASSIIDTAAATATVTPFVVASVVLPNANPIRVHGAYLIADQSNSSFIVNSRPFDDEIDSLGAVNVVIDANTVYDLNGVVYTGAAGLAAVGALQTNAPIAVVGTFTDISQVTPVLHATQVYSGNSLEGYYIDRVAGYVSARSGDTLTVHGALLTERLGVFSFFNDATVTVGASTIVNIDGASTTGLTPAAVSIGQQVLAVGQATLDATGTILALDATAGEVRIQSTRLWGTLGSAVPGSLVLGLTSIGPFEASAFDFAGTGVASASDASAASYAVNTGTIDQSATPAATQLRLDGLVTAFGSAPPDFNASAVAASPEVDSLLQVEWPGGTAAPFSSYSTASGLVVDLANASRTLSEIDTGPFSVDMRSLSASPVIVPDPVNGTNYSVGSGSTAILNSFTSFGSFVTQIGTELTKQTMRKLVAVGHYDSGTNTFIAKRINLVEQ